MKASIKKEFLVPRAVIIVGVIGAAIFFIWLGSWLANGGLPASGPTGNLLPPHVQRVTPADGEMIKNPGGICINFLFQAGRGMGYDPKRTVQMFLDGINVSKGLNGLITLDNPPSYGSLCYKPYAPLSAKWHTAKVIYSDISNTRFQYTWRFLIQTK
jgi:hypothetical protein